MIGAVSALEVAKPVAAQAGNSSLNDCWTTIKLYLVPICMQLSLATASHRYDTHCICCIHFYYNIRKYIVYNIAIVK